MKLYLNGILYAFSYALDCIEEELIGVHTGHSKRVAYFSVCLGKEYGLSLEELLDLAACATLHDNALTQYIAEEQKILLPNTAGKHCIYGEENIKNFPFRTEVKNVILYHHENADGSGYFHKNPKEIPLMAKLIHFADTLDAVLAVNEFTEEKYERIIRFVEKKRNVLFSNEIVDTFLSAFPKERFLLIGQYNIDELLRTEIPEQPLEYSFEQIKDIMDILGKIIDYKSKFTKNHSEGIAKKLWIMAKNYNYDKTTCERLYIAGIFHDIGKMAIENDILEKPGKLSSNEFTQMKNHAWYTYVILSQIKDFEDITQLASRHHEKLNGTGYPFGLTANDLNEKERLIGCVDIYQALSEDRPYKAGMKHEQCIAIMRDMVKDGFIDGKITNDIDMVFSKKMDV